MKFCHQCGNQNPDVAKFCGHCGYKFDITKTPIESIQQPEVALNPHSQRPQQLVENTYQQSQSNRNQNNISQDHDFISRINDNLTEVFKNVWIKFLGLGIGIQIASVLTILVLLCICSGSLLFGIIQYQKASKDSNYISSLATPRLTVSSVETLASTWTPISITPITLADLRKSTETSSPIITDPLQAATIAAPQEQSEPTTSNDNNKVIPGMSFVDVTMNLKNKGFKCDDMYKKMTTGYFSWSCNREDSTFYSEVSVWSMNIDTVESIEATTTMTSPNLEIPKLIYGFIATIPYTDAQPDVARSWVEETVMKVNNKDHFKSDFGNVPFEIYGSPSAISMDIGYAGSSN